jgi:hypothetical protein
MVDVLAQLLDGARCARGDAILVLRIGAIVILIIVIIVVIIVIIIVVVIIVTIIVIIIIIIIIIVVVTSIILVLVLVLALLGPKRLCRRTLHFLRPKQPFGLDRLQRARPTFVVIDTARAIGLLLARTQVRPIVERGTTCNKGPTLLLQVRPHYQTPHLILGQGDRTRRLL